MLNEFLVVKRILVTGGAGFIGSHLINKFLTEMPNCQICNLDALTYAADLNRLRHVSASNRYQFVKGSITDVALVNALLRDFRPHIVLNLAAESHVDNSIEQSQACIQTNIVGTHLLLEASRNYWQDLPVSQQRDFLFYQMSTDEVFGDYSETRTIASEYSAYRPSSPYSASKAAADHLVRAWQRTYQLPAIISTSSNNYGPEQHREKLIPKALHLALTGQPIPLYGDGSQQRDWVFVEDHVAAIIRIATQGQVGHTYLVANGQPISNIHLLHSLCDLLEEMVPHRQGNFAHYRDLITPVVDRPGHDRAYATNAAAVRRLGWRPQVSLPEGLRRTIASLIE